MPTALPPPVLEYLARHHVMTLATQSAAGPWAAAVFYAHDGRGLIFLSSPASRHCSNLAQDPRCAATIQKDYDDWPQIQGIQLEGRVTQLQGDEAARSRERYAQRFPIVGIAAKAPAAIVNALTKVRWYRLLPERLYFIDNTQGFGRRREIELTTAARCRQP